MREILKAASQTGTAAIASMVLGVIATKIMAVVLGPDGAGVYAILLQVLLTAVTLAFFGGSTALVQGLASRNGEARGVYLATTFWVFVAGTAMVSAGLYVLAPWLSTVLGGGGSLGIELLRWLAVPVACSVAYGYVSGVLNGFHAIGQLAVTKVISAAATAVLAYPAFRLAASGYPLALIGLMALGVFIPALAGLFFIQKQNWLRPIYHTGFRLFRWEAVKHFFSMAGTMLLVSQLTNVAMLAIIAVIQQAQGLATVGWFNAAWGLSMTYVMLVLTSFSTYYLPTLSRTIDPQARAVLMRNVFRLATVVLILLITAMIVFKPLVITILYSREFTESLVMVRWMLVGDYLKISSWVFAMTVVAYADMKRYLVTDSLWAVGFLLASIFSVRVLSSVEGIGAAFCLLYAAYALSYFDYVRRKYQFRLFSPQVQLWWGGFAIIIGASITTWDSAQVNWVLAAMWLAIAAGFVGLMLTVDERRKIITMIRLRIRIAQ
jgi:O-antigen/teichoic acid export membrane protein